MRAKGEPATASILEPMLARLTPTHGRAGAMVSFALVAVAIALFIAFSSRSDVAPYHADIAAPEAKSILNSLQVKPAESAKGYSRDRFGKAWEDTDGNGCDTRNDILARDMTDVTFQDGSTCVVASGTLADPYTGKTITFHRGKETSQAVQIDHVVPLSLAWRTGAQHLSATEREALANDPLNLLAVDGSANQAKGASDAAQWLPDNTGVHCAYVTRQLQVKQRYHLWVTPREKAAIANVLADCSP